MKGKTLTFTLASTCRSAGSPSPPAATTIIFTLDINGHPVTAAQVSQGNPASQATVTSGQVSHARA